MRLALALTMLLAVPAAASAQTFEDYTVQPGDSCASIAERFYGSPRRYDRIHDHNPDLGALPHRLRPGTVLRLPLPRETGADATVTDARGRVRRQLPTDPDWDGARIGDELRTGSRVSTGERSSAELTFRASTVAAIREETLVIVHGGSVERVRDEGSHAVLREGSMLSRLSSLSGGAPLVVETPTAEISVGTGEASVHVMQTSGDTSVSVHATPGGASARVRGTGAAGGEVEVPTGSGSRIRRGERPAPPRPLPAAPAWSAGGPRSFLGVFPGATTGGGTVSGSWLGVEGAVRYRVEIARREDGRDLVFHADVPATVTRFEAHGLPPGRYFVRVATLDGEMFEGRPAAGEAFEVVGVRLLGPAETAPEGEVTGVALLEELDALGDDLMFDAAPEVPQVLVGTRVVVPDGVVCAMGASDPSHELVLTTEGDGFLTCVDGAGATIEGMNVHVARVRARVLDAFGAPLTILPRAVSTDVRIAIDAIDLDTSALVMTARDGEVTEPVIGADGVLQTTVTPTSADASPVTLAFAVRTAPTIVLGTVEIPVEPPPPVLEPPEAIPTLRSFALHEGLGLFAMPSWVGLRDEQRAGIGGHLGLTFASARLGEPDPRVRMVAGATVGLFDDYLRISATAPLDVMGQASRSGDLGARDVYFSLGSRLARTESTAGIGLAVELGIWAPTAGQRGLDRGRLMAAADVSFRLLDRLAFRTRQAGIFDLAADASMLWASAYGFDVRVAGPLSLGIEGTMTIGREDARDWYAGGVGLGVGIDLSPVVISLAGRYGFGDDLWPTATVAANVRASFE